MLGNKKVRQSKRGIIFREGPKGQQSGMQFELISKAIKGVTCWGRIRVTTKWDAIGIDPQ